MTSRGGCPRRRSRALAVPLAALAALAVLASACGSGGTSTTQLTLVPVSGGHLTVGIDQEPSGCNPNATTGGNWASRLVLQAVLPSAFSVNAKGESSGNQSLVDQAELISTRPQTVVYTIDPHAVWSDGVPITAEDFRYAWEQQRGADPVTGLPAVQEASGLGYRSIKSLTSSNHGKTVTVVFRSPYADWQMLFGDLVPAHVMAKVGWNPACPRLDGSIDLSGGPYRIASVADGRIVLKVNHRWWGPAPLLSAVIVRVAAGPAQLGQWLRRGSAQVVQPGAVDRAYVQQVAGDPRAYSELDLSSTFVQLEFALAGPNTGSVEQREAIAHALNRQSLVSSLTGWIDANVVPAQSHLYVQGQNGYPLAPAIADAANPFVGSNQATTTTTTDPTPGSGSPFPTTDDLASTARLLTLGGYTVSPDGHWLAPGGTPVVLRLAADASDPWAAQAGSVVADQLRRAGFGVDLLTRPTGAATGAALAAGQADLAVLPFDAGPYPSRAVAWYTPGLGLPGTNGSANWSNLDDPTVNSLLASAEKELNPVKAQPIYAQVDQQLWTDMVALPLFAEPAVLGWSVRTYGVVPNFHGPSLFGTVATWQLRVPVSMATAATASTTTTTRG